MIRYSVTTILILLGAFVAQQFLPAFTGIYDSRVLLVQLVFLCCAVTVAQPVMLTLAFIGGFLWDAQCTLGPHGGDPSVYTQSVEGLKFGYSILLFAGMGALMQGIQPLFRRGIWQVSALLCCIAVFLYLLAEFAIITFVRGDLIVSRELFYKMAFTAFFTAFFSPLVFILLDKIARRFDHNLFPESVRKKRKATIPVR